MLLIRKPQWDRITGSVQINARSRHLADTIRRAWPAAARNLGSEGVENWIRHGMDRAGQHGISDPGFIERYIHLMFLLDSKDFDIDPHYAWAGRILAWPDADERLKLAALEKRAEIEQEKAIG